MQCEYINATSDATSVSPALKKMDFDLMI